VISHKPQPPVPAPKPAPLPLVTRAALGEPQYLSGGVWLPVVTVLDVRGGGL
jgi:hypothetical protein